MFVGGYCAYFPCLLFFSDCINVSFLQVKLLKELYKIELAREVSGCSNSVCQQTVKVLPNSLENYSAIAKTLLILHTLIFFTSPIVI